MNNTVTTPPEKQKKRGKFGKSGGSCGSVGSGVSSVLTVIGAVLIAIAVAAAIWWAADELTSRGRSEEVLSQLEALMPEVKNGSYDDRENVSQPMAEIGGESFIGIIELPMYNARLPVGGTWNKGDLKKFPRRFTGNVYNGGLVIGGSERGGQLDFMDSVTVYDKVFFTDVMGNRYSFEVTDIVISDGITDEVCDGAELVIFARRGYSDTFTVVKCNK